AIPQLPASHVAVPFAGTGQRVHDAPHASGESGTQLPPHECVPPSHDTTTSGVSAGASMGRASPSGTVGESAPSRDTVASPSGRAPSPRRYASKSSVHAPSRIANVAHSDAANGN